MMKWLLLLVLILFANSLEAQTEEIKKIRSHYSSVGALVKECIDANECELYQNELVINGLHGEWRGSGSFKKVIRFWYNDIPTHCDECGRKGINVLQKIEIQETSAGYIYEYELLFDKGELVFYYQTGGDEELSFRYYFKDEKLIRHMKDQSIISTEDIAYGQLLREGDELQLLFLSSF